MNRNRWLDFTPLLDVFLILLFVLLINQQVNESQIERSHATELGTLQEQNTQLHLALNQWEERSRVVEIPDVEDQLKYDFLQQRAVVIDLLLQTERNRLWINEQPTAVYLVNNEDLRESQKSRIKQELVREFQRQGGAGSLLLVTLNSDEQAYRYAYLMLQEAAQEWVGERPMPESHVLKIR